MCKSPPHKKMLDYLLNDQTIDRSVAHLLGYTQLNSRLHQTGSSTSEVRKKTTIVVNSTKSEDSENDSDSESDYNPTTDMSQVGDEIVLFGLERSKNNRQAMMDARKAKLRKAGSGSKGKGTVGSSSAASPCVTGDDTILMPPPRAAASRGKTIRTPLYYDVDRCARWEASSIDEGARAAMQNLPVLPRPRKSQDFGVIGAPPQYAYDVLAPYMSFGGDDERLKGESMDDGFGVMLEDSTALMARLSFHSHSAKESRREMEMRYHESQAEVDRMWIALDEAVARQGRLVQVLVAAYNRGAKEGGL